MFHFPFKPSADAYVLAVPLSFAVGSMAVMVAHACTLDWEQNRNLNFYLNQSDQTVERICQHYIHHPVSDYFKKRSDQKKTYGVFDNE